VIASEFAFSEASPTFVNDEQPGIRRRRAGTGFDATGARITERRELDRIRSLAIPSAWTDVWISAELHGHLQATGRDTKGRKQYRYHPRWREICEADKYEHLLDFGRALPRIRQRCDAISAYPASPGERALSTVVSLLESTMIRVGNEEYAPAYASYGLTMLRNRHVRVRGGELTLVFCGKSNVEHEVTIEDRRVGRIVRQLQMRADEHRLLAVLRPSRPRRAAA
jgi:DNA topoisomerase-1